MDRLIFKIGMIFSNIEEVRKAVNAQIIRLRVKTKRIKNYMTILHARCEDDCPWMHKAGYDMQRTSGFVITTYNGEHRCERVYQMRSLIAKFLAKNLLMNL
jgi:hypothetical protein